MLDNPIRSIHIEQNGDYSNTYNITIVQNIDEIETTTISAPYIHDLELDVISLFSSGKFKIKGKTKERV